MSTEARQSQASKASQYRHLRLDILPSVPRRAWSVPAVTAALFSSLPHKLQTLENNLGNVLPLMFATIWQAMVVPAVEIDLSIGGIPGVATAVAAARMDEAVPTILLWSVIALLIGVGLGASAGPIIAQMHVTPAVAMMPSWSDLSGVALSTLPNPSDGLRRVTTKGGDMSSHTC